MNIKDFFTENCRNKLFAPETQKMSLRITFASFVSPLRDILLRHACMSCSSPDLHISSKVIKYIYEYVESVFTERIHCFLTHSVRRITLQLIPSEPLISRTRSAKKTVLQLISIKEYFMIIFAI